MAADGDFKILVSAELDKGSIQNLKNQLNSGKPVEVNVQLSQKVFDQIKQLKSQLETLSKIKIDFGTTKRNQSFTQFANDLKASAKGLGQAVKEINKANQQIANAQRNVANATSNLNLRKANISLQMDTWLQKNSAAAKTFGQQIRQLQAELQTCDKTRLTGIQQEFAIIQKQAILAGQNVKTFGDRLKWQFQRFSSYITIATVFSTLSRSLRSMYNNVLEVDTAMTQLYRVTDLTKNQYQNLFSDMTASAKEYGATLSSIINSTASWVRLGFNEKLSVRLSEISSMYQHVTDLDESTAVKNLVTAYKGFESSLLESFNGDVASAIERISDIYDLLGNRFAESAADVGDGLAHSAAILAQGGASIEEAAGLFTGIQEVLQDSSTAGNTLKILTLRIRGMKGELQELGEEVDENIESVSKVQTQILNLTGGKVNIFDSNNNFRNIYDIMHDIAEIYDELSDVNRASLLEIIAGKSRSVGVQALIQNWENVEKATKAAYNAAGTAQEEQDKWANSLQGHLNRLTTAWQTFSTTFMGSDFLKGAIDVITGVVNGFNSLVDSLGTVNTLLLGGGIAYFVKHYKTFRSIGTELLRVKSVIASLGEGSTNFNLIAKSVKGMSIANTQAVLSTTGLSDAQKILILRLNGLSKEEAIAAISTQSMAASETGATVATTGFGAALKGLWTTLKANPIILIGAAVVGLISIISKANQSAEEYRQQIYDAGDAAKESADELYELSTKYSEAKESMADNVDATDDFITAQNNIMSALGLTGDSIDTLIQKYGSLSKAIEEATQNKLTDYFTDAYSAATVASQQALSNHRMTNITSGLLGDMVNESFNDRQREAELFNYLESLGLIKGNVSTLQRGQITEYSVSIDLPHATAESFDELIDNFHYLENIRNQIANDESIDFGVESLLFQHIDKAYQKMLTDIQDAQSKIDASNEILAQKIYLSSKEWLNSLTINDDTYEEIRQTLIDRLSSSNRFDKNGSQTAEFLMSSLLVDDAKLATLENQLLREKEAAKSAEELEEHLQEIRDRIAKTLVGDSVAKSVIKDINALSDAELLEAEKMLDAGLTEYESVYDFLNTVKEIVANAQTEQEELNQEVQELLSGVDLSGTKYSDIVENKDLKGYFDSYKEQITALTELYSLSADEIKERRQEFVDILSDSDGFLAKYAEQKGLNIDNIINRVLQGTSQGKMSAKTVALGMGNFFDDLSDTLVSQMDTTGSKALLTAYFEGLLDEAEEAIEEIEPISIGELFGDSDFKSDKSSYESQIKIIQQAMSELKGEAEQISQDTLDDIYTTFGDEIVSGMFDFSGSADKVEQQLNQLFGVVNDKFSSTMDDWKSSLKQGDEGVFDLWFKNITDTDINALVEDIEEVAEEVTDSVEEVTNVFSDDDFNKAVSDKISVLKELQELLDDWRNGDINENLLTEWVIAHQGDIDNVQSLVGEIDNLDVAVINLAKDIEETNRQTFFDYSKTLGDNSARKELLYYFNAVDQDIQDRISAMSDFVVEKLSFSELREDDEFSDIVDTYINDTDRLKDALADLADGASEDEVFKDLMNDFVELGTDSDNLETKIRELLKSMDSNLVKDFEQQFGRLETKEDVEKLQEFMDTVLRLGQVVGSTQFAIDIDTEVDSMNNLFDAMKESVSSTGLTIESINNLKQRYQNLENYDPSRLFEHTTNGIHLNTNALRELETEYENVTRSTITDKLLDLNDDYNDLTERINNYNSAVEESSLIDLYAQRDDVLTQINDIAILASQYDGLTSAFYRWEQAQSIGEEGDMYDSLAGGLENINELYKQGLIGTNKFRTAVQLMTNMTAEEFSQLDDYQVADLYAEQIGKMARYFTEGSDGVLNFLHDVENLNSEWVHMNEDGSWDIDFGVGSDTEIADALGINVESVQSILRKLSDYGFDINLDTAITNLDKFKTKAEQAAESLTQAGKTSYAFNFDTTNIDRINEEISEVEKMISDMEQGELGLDYNEEDLENARTVLAELIMQKQKLDESAIMRVDTTTASSGIASTIELLQQFKTQYNELEVETAIGADTTDAETNLQTLIDEIAALEPDVKAALDLTEITSESTAEEVQTAIDNISASAIIAFGIDASAVETYAEEDKSESATVTYIVNDTAVQNYSAPQKTGKVSYSPDLTAINNTNFNRTAYITYKSTGVSGTTKAQGTAFARGNWGTSGGGTALMGEVGQELIVRNGRFFTVGDNGAEFVNYQPNDIIFNAEQTRQLLANGKITNGIKRGQSYLEGTAFSSGRGKITASGSVITTPSSSYNGGGSNGSSNGGSSAVEEAEEFSEILDEIVIKLDRIERDISNLDKQATSTYRSWSSRNQNLYAELSKVSEEINLQTQAYYRYIQEANSVGLSEDWASKVRDGRIDIETITDEELYDKIQAYQDWYEKALNCRDAIYDLQETESSLYETAFTNVSTQYSGLITLIQHEKNMLDEYIQQTEESGYIVSTKYYDALKKNQTQQNQQLEQERTNLLAKLSEAVNSGTIKEGSEAWVSMCNAIDQVTESIEEGKTALIEYDSQIRQIKWDIFDLTRSRVSNLASEGDFLMSLLGSVSNKSYDERGQLTATGTSIMGLHGMNYNIYMAQADAYAKEMQDISKQLANDPNNQELYNRRQKLLEQQQEMILSAENEKEAIVDMVKEGIELELDSLKKLIDTYTDSLDKQKDLYEYQKKIKEQTKEIATLEKQLSAYRNDTSEESRMRIQKITVSLDEAREKLEETQYEKYISDQKELLNNLYDEYELILNQRLDNIDLLISDMIGYINSNASLINQTISTETGNVGYTITECMSAIWNTNGAGYNALNGIMSVYSKDYSSTLTTIQTTLNGIAIAVSGMVTASDDKANENINQEETKTSAISPSAQTNPSATTSRQSIQSYTPTQTASTAQTTNASTQSAKIDTDTAMHVAAAIWNGNYGWGNYPERKTKLNEVWSNGWDVVQWIVDQGYWYSAKYSPRGYSYTEMRQKFKGYASGKRKLLNDELAFTQEGNKQEMIIRPSDGAILTPLAKGDSVLNAVATNNLWNMANDPSEFIRESLGIDYNGNIDGKSSISVGDNNTTVNMSLSLPNVQNYEEFKYALQHDINFEKMVQAMTIGKMFGGGNLKKYQYR